jgi:hypothetical protein
MAEPYQLPTAKVLSAILAANMATVTIEISQEDYLGYPIAPADLRKLDTGESVFDFHQLIGRKGAKLVFETYKPQRLAPCVGATYAFCSWWIPNAMDAVRDMSAKWNRLPFPDDGQHDHCLLTNETISAYAERKEGYRSVHGWITVEAYREFIERDRLRIRNNNKSIERST